MLQWPMCSDIVLSGLYGLFGEYGILLAVRVYRMFMRIEKLLFELVSPCRIGKHSARSRDKRETTIHTTSDITCQ